jgi:hypothetical protein
MASRQLRRQFSKSRRLQRHCTVARQFRQTASFQMPAGRRASGLMIFRHKSATAFQVFAIACLQPLASFSLPQVSCKDSFHGSYGQISRGCVFRQLS